MYKKVAQWLKFCAVNHAIMGSNPAETVYNFFTYFYLIVFVVFLLIFHVYYNYTIYLFIITTMHVQHK